MSLNKFAPAIALAMLSLLLLIAPAHASTATVPKPIGGLKPSNPAGIGVQIAINTLLQGIGWIMDEGTKIDKKTPEDSPANDTSGQTGVSGTTATPTAGGQSLPIGGAYPLEYIIAGNSFSSVESACSYVFSDEYLSKQGLKRTRRPTDGLYYDNINVYLGKQFGYSDVGNYRCFVQVGKKDEDYTNNMGGEVKSFFGQIFYKGTESTSKVTVGSDYAKQREEAKKAVEQAINEAIANALPKPVPDDQPLPGEEDSPDTKPTPVPVPVPDDLPTVAPNDPAKPDTKPETQPETQPKPVPSPSPAPAPDVVPQPQPETQPKPSPSPSPEPQPSPNPSPSPEPVPIPSPSPSPSPETQPQPSPNPSPSPEPVPIPSPSPSPSPETQPQPSPSPSPSDKPQDESKPSELPAFCDWATKVCDWIDWTQKDDPDNGGLDIQDTPIPKIDTSINFNGQCPNDVIINGSFAGKNFEFFNFKWHKFCEILSYIKYIIVSMALYQAVKILGGVNVND